MDPGTLTWVFVFVCLIRPGGDLALQQGDHDLHATIKLPTKTHGEGGPTSLLNGLCLWVCARRVGSHSFGSYNFHWHVFQVHKFHWLSSKDVVGRVELMHIAVIALDSGWLWTWLHFLDSNSLQIKGSFRMFMLWKIKENVCRDSEILVTVDEVGEDCTVYTSQFFKKKKWQR